MAARRYKIKITTTEGLVVYWVKRGQVHTLDEDLAKIWVANFKPAIFQVTRDGRPVAVQKPEKRVYPVQNMPTTEAAIHTTILADLYTAIGDPDGKGGQTVRIFYEPLVPWIWAGTLMMLLGGAISLSDRRLRVGAPKRKRAQALAAARA